ncbi:MAG: hypothetical protein WCY24_07850, partial [Lutispora sp.]
MNAINNIKSSRFKEKVAFSLLWGFSVITIIILVLILANIILNGVTGLSLSFLLEEPRKMGKEGGILSVIISTFYIVILSTVFAAPIGVGASVYLTEYAKKGILL